ncbi:MAG TPA: GNAT family N-acyltransferase [Kineosporiaceae bacterium]|nr:GNAT family N-acyltransferase [Kineosporiaceae bacterium]
MATTRAVGILDGLVARVLADYPYRFTLPQTADGRTVAFRLRGRVVGTEIDRDAYDDVAVQVVGWADDVPVCTGRLVVPPNPLPTQDACDLVVEPVGAVVDVGRMCVAPEYRSYRHAAFVALLCRLYLEMRERGFAVACGMMAPGVRRLMRQLGLVVEELGPDRPYLGEHRGPVRFSLLANTESLPARWR